MRFVPFKDQPCISGQVIQIARPTLTLHRGGRGCHPGWEIEVEELRHIHLNRVPFGKGRQVKSSFNQLKDRGMVCHFVIHIMFSGVW